MYLLFKINTSCRGVTVQQEACCKRKASSHAKRAWILVLLEAISNLCPWQHVAVLQQQLMNPHTIPDRCTEADRLGS